MASHETDVPSSGSDNADDDACTLGARSDRSYADIALESTDPEDSPIDLAEPPPKRSLPPIHDKLYASGVVKPSPSRRRKHGVDGRPIKTGEISTSDSDTRRPRKRPPPIPAEKPKSRRIRVAPLNIPLVRRLQTTAVLLHEFTIPLWISLFWFLLAIPLTWPILIPYLVYTLISTPHIDGSSPRRRSRLLRRLPIWQLYTSYFPLKLHASAELDPHRNYIFTYHPHGILSHGAFGHFCTERTTGFESLFPGITNTLLTLDSNFRVPFYRDYLLLMGLASVSRRSCEALLRGETQQNGSFHVLKPWTYHRLLFHPTPPTPPPPGGRAITIVLGGARESLEATPGRMALVVKRRRGALKIAIRENAGLVPVLSFGENELYEQVVPGEGSWVARLQMAVKKVAGFTVPVFWARGVFNYDVGLMPYRREVNTVVGRPVFPREQLEDPRDVDVEELQGRYLDEIQRLWEEWKDVYAKDRRPGAEGELMFVG